jgi:diacylglycerol kinase family enzyme
MAATASERAQRLLEQRAQRLQESLTAAAGRPARRLLIIVNPYATTVSDRLRNLVVYALRGRYEVDAVDTERRGHATEICREAADGGYDLVVAFGGDGTVNEAANGLVGTSTPLGCLPGGRANVFCRILGIPADIIDATEHLLSLADDWSVRHVDLGRVNGRCFAFSAGVGLDADVVATVDAHPRRKARLGEWYYASVAFWTFTRRYLLGAPRLEVQLGDQRIAGATVIVQNASPYTYFGDRPVQMAERASLTDGRLGGVVLRRATPMVAPTIAWRALSPRAAVARHRQIHAFAELTGLTVRSADGRPLPLQVDGDYIGTCSQADFDVLPLALRVVA